MIQRIYLSPPHMGGTEIKYVNEAFKTNWIAPLGPNVNGFEKEMCEYLKIKDAAALSSGTGAIHLALIMLGIKPDDEVICQSLTFSASANPIIYLGAKPIFIDSEQETWNMDPDLLVNAIEKGISQGNKPKAVIIVHLYGQPAKMDKITEICNRYEIPLIEDAAEALGSSYKGIMCGNFGEMGILSFNGNKIITTSGGGMLVSNNIEYIQKAMFLATQARDEAPHYEHSTIGYNYRMSNIIAGVGRGQLEILPERVKRKRDIFQIYFNELNQVPGIIFQPEPEETKSNKWLTVITVNPEIANTNREEIRLKLEEHNIESRPVWKPMHLQPVFKECKSFENGISEKLFKNGLCLPSGTAMKDSELSKIIDLIKTCFK